jgi:enamine deaminase RidA (YjgF/YER057c/UK114 family)
MTPIQKQMAELGVRLPAAPPAVGAYAPVIRVGKLVVTSGQLPWQDGELLYKGKLGIDLTLEQGYTAARMCALNGLAQLEVELGDLNAVRQFLRIEGYVQSGPGFQDQPHVLNGASDLINAIFGPRGRHTRTAIAVSEMPLNAPVQLVLWAEAQSTV